MMALFMAFFGGMMLLGSAANPDGPPAFVMLFMFLFMGVIYGGMTLPSFVAGYGLLKGKRWARTWAIIAGVVSAMSFPIGTAVCVYTFWFLFSEPGKAIFESQRYGLPPRRQMWIPDRIQQEKPVEYVPPQTPPDWR